MTAEASSPTKAQLLDALRTSGSLALDKLRALPPDAFEQGRYESGWNAHQILAHVASIEWTYTRLVDLARQAPGGGAAAPQPVRRTEAEEAKGLPTRTARGGIDDYNARQVAKRAGTSVDELLAEFERNRAATIAAVEAADEAVLSRPIRSAGGITGTLAGVLHAVAVQHVLAHAGDIVGEQLSPQRW